MKKLLILAFVICVLFLSACGSALGTDTSSSSSASRSVTQVTTTSVQRVCQVLHNRQAQLKLEYQAASAELRTAQAHGTRQQEGAAEKALMRLRQSMAQGQAQLKVC